MVGQRVKLPIENDIALDVAEVECEASVFGDEGAVFNDGDLFVDPEVLGVVVVLSQCLQDICWRSSSVPVPATSRPVAKKLLLVITIGCNQ